MKGGGQAECKFERKGRMVYRLKDFELDEVFDT
jgi:hypothetical protein